MTSKPFTAREVSKFIVTSIVASKAAVIASDTITDHTHFEEDDLVVSIGSHVVGWYVGHTVKPLTDKIVDKTADFVTEQRIKRQIKKNAK